MKRVLAAVLCIFLLLCLWVPPASAAAVEGSCGESLTWTLDTDGTLTISGTGKMADFPAAAPWAAYKTQILSLSVAEGVTTLGNAAFSGCSRLSDVALPGSLTAIGDEAFRACHALTQIAVPNNVTRLGDRAFFACSELSEVQLPAKLKSIGGSAFESCTALTALIIPNGVAEISSGAFRDCTALAHMELPGSVKHVTSGLFSGCESLKSVVLGDGIESIASEAFSSCGLESVSIPASVKAVYQTAFQECWALKTAEIAAEEVGTAAFLDCWALASVTFEKTVKKLGKNIFGGCSSLTDVAFLGAKPELAANTFNEVTATVSYPEEKTITWTDAARQDYGGELTWQQRHDPELVSAVEPTCTAAGNPAYWRCLVCGKCFSDADGETEISQPTLPALGHAWDDGAVTLRPTTVREGIRTFTCTRCEAIRTEPIDRLQITVPFRDVDKDAYYAAAVEWAVAEQITNGMTADTFAPEAACTRGQIVTFLWRAAGKPMPDGMDNPFVDIKQDDYYYVAVLWATELGITTGTSETTFSPADGCTRGQVVTFLWRYAAASASDGDNPFTDVLPTAYYAPAVLWAVQNEITNGTTPTTFSPDQTCTRAQIVTFLYRALAE